MKLAKVMFVASFAVLALSAVTYACTSNPSVSANVNGYTLLGTTTANNPLTGNPYGNASTQSSSPMNTLYAYCTIYNSDGSSTTSATASAKNATLVVSQNVTADSYWSSGVYIISEHRISDSRLNGGAGWAASSTYCY